MGHGAPRTLDSNKREIKRIDDQLSERLERAFKILDGKDEEFAQGRADERHQQVSKAWNLRCTDIVEDLRAIGYAIVGQHQVLCDCGQDGAGITMTPFLEEAGQRFPKLQIKLKGVAVVAVCDDKVLLQSEHYNDADYDWLERAAVEWMVYAITTHT